MRNKKLNLRKSKHCNVNGRTSYIAEEELLSNLSSVKNPLLLILDCIQDPHNLGACLRSANGAGVLATIIPKDKSVQVNETVRRVSAGGIDYTPVCRVTNLVNFMKKLKKAGIWIIGTDDVSDKNIYQTDLSLPMALVMGSEGKGLRQLTKKNCDLLMKIPMFGEIDCLNVSVASGICLYEAIRQRLAK